VLAREGVQNAIEEANLLGKEAKGVARELKEEKKVARNLAALEVPKSKGVRWDKVRSVYLHISPHRNRQLDPKGAGEDPPRTHPRTRPRARREGRLPQSINVEIRTELEKRVLYALWGKPL
jgi:hypothetical protein